MTGKLALTALILAFAGYAQAQTPDKLLLIGASANGFKGELNQYYNRFKPGLHATLQFNEKKRLNGTFNLQAGQLQMQSPLEQLQISEESTSSPVNFVETSFIALHYDLHLNLLKTDNWIIYLSQGAGLMRFTPKDAEGNSLTENAVTRNQGEEYNQFSVLFPTSFGVQYIFNNGYGIGAQAGILNPMTNYLDNMEDLAGNNRSDNVLQYRFSLMVPLSFKSGAPMME